MSTMQISRRGLLAAGSLGTGALLVPAWARGADLLHGGVTAAPFGGWLVKRVPPRPMLCFVGLLVIALSIRTLSKHFGVAGLP